MVVCQSYLPPVRVSLCAKVSRWQPNVPYDGFAMLPSCAAMYRPKPGQVFPVSPGKETWGTVIPSTQKGLSKMAFHEGVSVNDQMPSNVLARADGSRGVNVADRGDDARPFLFCSEVYL